MEDQHFDIRRLLGLLRRQARLIVLTLVLALGATTIVLFALKPAYTASALVLVDPSNKDLLAPDEPNGASPDSARVESEVELVKSATTLLAAAKDARLEDMPEFAPHPGLLDTALQLLRISTWTPPGPDEAQGDLLAKVSQAVSVQRRGLTYLISIQAQAGDRVVAARLANAVADAYIRGQLDAKIAGTLNSRDIIQGRITEANDSLVDSEQAFNDFITTTIDTIAPDDGSSKLTQLRNQLKLLEGDRQELSAALELSSVSITGKDWTSAAQGLQSETVTRLEQQRQALAAQLAGLSEGSPTAVDLRGQLKAIEQNINVAASSALNSMRQQLATNDSQIGEMQSQLKTEVLGSSLPSDVLGKMYDLQQRSELARSQYQSLLARLKDLEAQAYLQVADSRVVAIANPPGSPSSPNARLMFVLATFGGIGLGIALAFLRENYVGGMTSEGQVESVLKAPLVVGVPREKVGKGSSSVADFVTRSPLSVFAESVRKIRAGVDQALHLKSAGSSSLHTNGSVVVVTSSAAGEGKTTIALALARSYALAGRKVLLIDCDLRKPSVHAHLGLEVGRGLLDYLQAGDPVDVSTAAIKDAQSDAAILLGTHRSDAATDHLITGKALAQIIDNARSAYEVVILDTPPVGPVVDALYLAQFAEIVVFVLRWARTPQNDAKSALALLQGSVGQEGKRLLVLNQLEGPESHNRSRYSGYYEAA